MANRKLMEEVVSYTLQKMVPAKSRVGYLAAVLKSMNCVLGPQHMSVESPSFQASWLSYDLIFVEGEEKWRQYALHSTLTLNR